MTNTKSDMDVKIGVMIWPDSLDIEPDVADRFQKALNKLQASHSPFARIDMTDYDFSAARRAGLLISEYEGAQYHAAQYEKTPEGFSEAFMSMLNWAVDQPPEKHEQAEAVISSVQARAAEVFQNIDILIAPTAPQTAFAFGSPIPVGQADFTAFANLCDLAAAQIAIESGRNGLPVGLQIIGPDNGVVLAIAESFENRLRVRN